MLPDAVPQGLQTENLFSVHGTFESTTVGLFPLRGAPLSHRCGLTGRVAVALKEF